MTINVAHFQGLPNISFIIEIRALKCIWEDRESWPVIKKKHNIFALILYTGVVKLIVFCSVSKNKFKQKCLEWYQTWCNLPDYSDLVIWLFAPF